MPEENKEKFTFSDKIKNSKPAGNKSFAKSSSKIGRDGKPKATLFERTRRDAPFFIAALVALLLLPFLYKYSGQASEEQLLTPGSEQADFDPERYGFDTAMIEDPDGQIAQLAGRDSLSLIKGFGGNQEEDYGRDDMDLDASASYDGSAEGEYAAEKHSSSEMDVEDNTTNIYKRRAGRATRAAFRRTKIGTLNAAGLRRPGGSRLGINNWGGGLKGAARRVGPSVPTSGPKPVSLQPLRAAGSRSTFGQGGAAAARRSKDNMGKADPREALRDSYVKPVEPTRTGGLDLFSDGRMGGSGKLGRNINITPGKEPWWWDMMKTRMQKEWEARFKRKWDWINWADNLARHILGGILNCLITGDDDGDMGSFFGYGAGGGKAAKCGSLTASDWSKCTECQKYGAFGSHSCKAYLGHMSPDSSEYKKGWQDGNGGDKAAGFFSARLNCLGIGGSGYLSGELGLNGAGMQCTDMPNYTVIPSGEARKWNIYTYVVARNYFPESLKKKLNLTSLQTKNGEQNLLCASMDRRNGGTSLNHNDPTAGVGYVKAQEEKARQAVIEQTRATKSVPQEQQKIRERTLEVDQESLGDGCVIVVSRGNVLPYEAMKNQIMDLFKQLGKNVTDQDAEQAFYELDLMYVSSFAAKQKLAYAQWFESGHNLKGLLPMPYWEFDNAYIQHRKTTHKKDGSRDNVFKRKFRVDNVDMVGGPICYYDNLNFECGPEDTATATLHFDRESFKGGSGVKPSENDVKVSAEFRYLDNPDGIDTVTQPMIKPNKSADNGFTFTYTFDRIYDSNKVKHTDEAVKLTSEKGGLVGNIIWTAQRGEQVVTRTCTLNLSGDGKTPGVEEKPRQVTPPPAEEPKPQAETRLAPQLTWVPCGATDRQAIAAGKSPSKNDFGSQQSCYILKGIDREHCAGSVLEMDSNTAKEFVLAVVDAYNATNPAVKMSKQLSGEHGFPTDGEFLDALNIADTLLKNNNSLQSVSASAVCEFGRDMVRMSQDKHTGDMRMAQPAETPYGSGKEINSLFHNELGAFLAYVHPQAIFYPQVLTGNGQQCDHRFLVFSHRGCVPKVNWKSQACIYGGENKCKEYHFVNYNAVPPSLTIAYNAFMNSLTATQKQAPLAGLTKGKNFPAVGAGAKGGYKDGPGEKYIKEITGLIREHSGFVAWQGQACESYTTGMPKIEVSKVLTYVRGNQGKGGVCNDGLDYKPHGSPGNPGGNQTSNASVGVNPTGQGS